LQELINSLHLQDKIFLKGHSNDVKKVLEGSHLLLQLTRQDAMPLSVIEAMAVGRPVAVTDVGDMPYWIDENRNGWICKHATDKEVNETMERAWQQKEKWKEMGEASFLLFKEKFPASAEASLLEKLEALAKS
jgi:glycosyltransferase involved in cell wall biosynthesis